MTTRPYHHGDLRRALLDHALTAIADVGPAHLSLRDLARRAGVSHAAPAHHFGDKAGLLTAVAAEGHEKLADRLESVDDAEGLLGVGVAYVTFAVTHRAHFDVMFRPDLYDAQAPEVLRARERAGQALRRGVEQLPPGRTPADVDTAAMAAWALVHGLASLWLTGVVPPRFGADPALVTAQVAQVLFAGPTAPGAGP